LTKRHIDVKTMEVNRPEVDPQLVAQDIAEQLQKRVGFRRTMKRAMDNTMEGGAKGIKVQMSGRLGGSEMARQETACSEVSRFRRCEPRSISALPKHGPRRAISALKFGSITVTI